MYLFVVLLYHFSALMFSSFFFFFKQKTAYEMRISDWSSDVCSSDLPMALTPIMQTPITQTQARTSTPPPRQPLGDQFRMRPGLMPWTRSYAPESGKRSTGDG